MKLDKAIEFCEKAIEKTDSGKVEVWRPRDGIELFFDKKWVLWFTDESVCVLDKQARETDITFGDDPLPFVAYQPIKIDPWEGETTYVVQVAYPSHESFYELRTNEMRMIMHSDPEKHNDIITCYGRPTCVSNDHAVDLWYDMTGSNWWAEDGKSEWEKYLEDSLQPDLSEVENEEQLAEALELKVGDGIVTRDGTAQVLAFIIDDDAPGVEVRPAGELPEASLIIPAIDILYKLRD